MILVLGKTTNYIRSEFSGFFWFKLLWNTLFTVDVEKREEKRPKDHITKNSDRVAAGEATQGSSAQGKKKKLGNHRFSTSDRWGRRFHGTSSVARRR